jgi:hypothetical protein
LKRVWGFEWNRHVIDTLVLSRLLAPASDGGHSLRALAEAGGRSLKEDFDKEDFDRGDVPVVQRANDRLLHRRLPCKLGCIQDLLKKKEELGFSDESYDLEAEVRRITTIQEDNGFKFDFDQACLLYNNHKERMDEIED